MKTIHLFITIITTIFFSSLFAQNSIPFKYRICNNCSMQENNDNLNTIYTYGNIIDYQSEDVTSDFGARYNNYDWHKGVDFRPLQFAGLALDAGRGTAIISASSGGVKKINATSGYKYIVIEGSTLQSFGFANLGYGHIFNSSNPDNNVNGIQSGKLILKRMDNPNNQYFAIFDKDRDTAIGVTSGHVTVGGVQYPVITSVSSDETIASMGGSGGGFSNNDPFPCHVHLYRFRDINAVPIISYTHETNCMNPLKIITHDEPEYNVKIKSQGQNFGQINIVYPGDMPTKFQIRTIMSGATNIYDVLLGENGSANRYGNVVMNMNGVYCILKKPYNGTTIPLQGTHHYGKIQHGGDFNTMYPTYMSLNDMKGSWERQGIAPSAYKDVNGHPYDEFYLTDFVTRIHKNDVMGADPTLIAALPEDARYNDGNYNIRVDAVTIKNITHTGPKDNQGNIRPIPITLDNFKPYIKRVSASLLLASPFYDKEWKKVGDKIELTNNLSSTPSLNPYSLLPIYVSVTSSEPLFMIF